LRNFASNSILPIREPANWMRPTSVCLL
jgi:hypothetical protein